MKALKSLGDKFITGLADLVGGEKDPRNLMIVFSVMKVVLVEFDIVRHTEAMFDIVYCYFPITFRQRPDDPYGITPQDLKLRLRECIASTKYFAGQAFPLLIEKLDSTMLNVKVCPAVFRASYALTVVVGYPPNNHSMRELLWTTNNLNKQ